MRGLPSRRDVLRSAGKAAGALATRPRLLGTAGGILGVGAGTAACADDEPGPKAGGDRFPFEHFVVLMLENRSFDNMVGYLYEPGQVPRGQSFEGVAGKQLSNPIPSDAESASRGVVPVEPGTVMDNPRPDPGEDYPHINTQLFGTVDPSDNALKAALDMSAPFNEPNPIPNVAPMSGFVADYINNFTHLNGRAPTYDEYRVIMNCFSPDAVPVISALAKGFAVCDHWHCEVPSQTFCNRSFFHAGTSSGLVTNEPFESFPKTNDAETLFNRLDDHKVSWRIYYDPEDRVSLTALD